MNASLGHMFRRICAGHQKRINAQFVTDIHGLTSTVFPSAHGYNAIIARNIMFPAKVRQLLKRTAARLPIDIFVPRCKMACRAHAFPAKPDAGPGVGLDAFFANSHNSNIFNNSSLVSHREFVSLRKEKSSGSFMPCSRYVLNRSITTGWKKFGRTT